MFVGLFCWKLQRIVTANGAVLYKLLPAGEGIVDMKVVLDADLWVVVPTEVLSPASRYLVQVCRLTPDIGCLYV